MVTRALEFERRLEQALEVEVPAGLRARILLRQAFAGPPTRPLLYKHRYALAASMLLTVSLAGGFWYQYRTSDFEPAIFAHVLNEPHFETGTEHIQQSALNAILRPISMEVNRDLGNLIAASVCEVRKQKVAHIVLEGDQSLVAVLVMPHEQTQRRTAMNHKGLSASLIPIKGGTMAVVGKQGERFEEIAKRVRSATRWKL